MTANEPVHEKKGVRQAGGRQNLPFDPAHPFRSAAHLPKQRGSLAPAPRSLRRQRVGVTQQMYGRSPDDVLGAQNAWDDVTRKVVLAAPQGRPGAEVLHVSGMARPERLCRSPAGPAQLAEGGRAGACGRQTQRGG